MKFEISFSFYYSKMASVLIILIIHLEEMHAIVSSDMNIRNMNRNKNEDSVGLREFGSELLSLPPQ